MEALLGRTVNSDKGFRRLKNAAWEKGREAEMGGETEDSSIKK